MIRIPLLPGWFRWGLTAAVVGIVVTFSIIPLPPGVTQSESFGMLGLRKYLHLLSYLGLAAVLMYALADSPRPDWQLLVIVFVVTTGFGVGLEFLQMTLAYRTFEVVDMLMNATGTAIAVIVWRFLLRRGRFNRVEPLSEI